jgi:hypothetical protein
VTTIDPVEDLLGRLDGVKQTGPGQYMARCPSHDDRHASLSVGRGDDGRALIDCKAGCSPLEVVQAMGLRMNALFPPKPVAGKTTAPTNGKGKSAAKGRIVATYDYRDSAGALAFQVVRFDPKDFCQCRSDGEGHRVWGLSAGEYAQGKDGDWYKVKDRTPADAPRRQFPATPRVLYSLSELLAADKGTWVFVVEGEKDADNLAALCLVATTNPGGAGKWKHLADDSALHGRRVAIVPDKDGPGLAHAQDVAARLHGKAAVVKVIDLPDGEVDGRPVKDASDWIESLDGRTSEELAAALVGMAEAASTYQPNDGVAADRPTILIDTEEHRVVRDTVAALTADPGLYQRGGILVRVLRDTQPKDDIIRPAGSPTIQALPTPNLRERMTRHASFTKTNKKGKEVPAHPAAWLVSAVDARGDWPGIRHLSGVSDAPVLRADGSVWQQEGYDGRTGVLFEASQSFPAIADGPTIDDAMMALDVLLEVVCDFRFESDEHRAAWFAGLLTPLARFAFDGPSPLFLIDANIRGAGKGLLAQTIGRIALGREMPVSSYAHESEEMRKRITAIAIAGDRTILLDNLEGVFGNDALDRALTSTRWKDRILGRSEEIDLPLFAAWYATGNNVSVAADTARRVIHIRLDVLDERPEERTGFRHPNLMAWVAEHRGRLLASALTVLSAYCKAGRPSQGLTPYGSFEGWSALVREAVVWVGLPDPCLTRIRLAESSDTTAESIGQLVSAWREYDPSDAGVVVSEMMGRLYPAQGQFTPTDAASKAMRLALENVVSCPAGKAPTPRQVGNKLRHFRRRVQDGVFLDFNPNVHNRAGAVWRLCHA